jgi:hypothetical protein
LSSYSVLGAVYRRLQTAPHFVGIRYTLAEGAFVRKAGGYMILRISFACSTVQVRSPTRLS